MRVVVVGASIGGVTVAQSLRDLGHDGEIVLVEASPETPYQRPPLSKEVLLGADPGCADLIDSPALASLGVTLVTARATGIEVASRTLRLGGATLPYDELVLASGATAALPPDLRPLADDGAHVLRTRRDAIGLAAALTRHRELTVLGGGVLGSEIAAAAVASGLRTTLVTRGRPSLGPLRGRLAAPLLPLHRRHGVQVATDPCPPHRTAAGWRLSSTHAPAPADAVAIAVGVRAHADWMTDSLPVGPDGVRCDGDGRVAPGVWAVGDVADRAGCADDVSRRTQAAAVSHARGVAATIVGVPTEVAVPYFWSDLHGVRVQAAGRIPRGAAVEVVEHDDDGTPVCFAVGDQRDLVVGVAAWGSARGFRDARRLLGHAMPADTAALEVAR